MNKRFFVILFLMSPLLFGGKYGVGIIIGSPTGFTGKHIMAKGSAIAVNAGWSLLGEKGFHVTGDYQFLFPGVIKNEEGEPLESVVPYFGIGGSFRFKENEATDETDFHVGMRIGGGIEYLVTRFGVFLELYPVVDFLPETDFDFEGGLGFRFYFY